MASQYLDLMPLWVIYLLVGLVAFLAAEIGYQLGRMQVRRQADLREGSLGAIVGTTFGLLAFLLALLMTIGLSRYDNRRSLVVQEANAIGTTYLRAGYLEAPYSSEMRALLQQYLDTRLQDPATSEELISIIIRSTEIQISLWSLTEALARDFPDSEVVSLFISSLNDMIDLQETRLAAFRARIPASIWISVLFVGLFAFGLIGFHNGHQGSRGLPALIILILAFSAVVLLIADLDRPLTGFLRASQQPMQDLQEFIDRLR